MTNLPSQHPTLSLHLTDNHLQPLITSSSSPSHLDALTSITTSALTSQTAVQRAGLGRPQRIMVEYPDRGAVVLQSYLEAPTSTAAVAGSAATAASSEGEGISSERGDHPSTRPGTADGGSSESPPMLVGVVVAGSADEAREARRAASRLERLGRDFQREWAKENGDQASFQTSS